MARAVREPKVKNIAVDMIDLERDLWVSVMLVYEIGKVRTSLTDVIFRPAYVCQY